MTALRADKPDVSPDETRAWFPERPVDSIVQEIKQYIRDGGMPHQWRGHTHTRPPAGATVRYIGEFDIPGAQKGRLAPCPCCTPSSPKYGRGGKIAWFPDESVIRMIGPDCFATLNKEGHADALTTFHAEEQRRKDIAYLLGNLGVVPRALDVAAIALKVATELDRIGLDLHGRICDVLGMRRLWDQLREGVLNIQVRREEVHVTRNLEERRRVVEELKRYASIDGDELLDPKRRPIAPMVESSITRLQAIPLARDVSALVADMADEQRKKVARDLNFGVKKLREAVDRITAERRFFSTVTIATLRTWGKHPDCPTPFHIERNGDVLYVGRRADQQVRIDLGDSIDLVLSEVPSLRTSDL